MTSPNSPLWIAFADRQRIAQGHPRTVASAAWQRPEADPAVTLAVLDARTSVSVELDLRGTLASALQRLPQANEAPPYQIETDGNGETEAFPWKVRIALDIEETGPVQAEIALRGQLVAVTLWAERQSKAALARDEIGALHEALTGAAFDVFRLEVKDRRPGDPPAAVRERHEGAGAGDPGGRSGGECACGGYGLDGARATRPCDRPGRPCAASCRRGDGCGASRPHARAAE